MNHRSIATADTTATTTRIVACNDIPSSWYHGKPVANSQVVRRQVNSEGVETAEIRPCTTGRRLGNGCDDIGTGIRDSTKDGTNSQVVHRQVNGEGVETAEIRPCTTGRRLGNGCDDVGTGIGDSTKDGASSQVVRRQVNGEGVETTEIRPCTTGR